ncbi:hypothetical protein AB0J01_27965 [Streptomyces sp. NPDC050204]|uniref:hypothetical protein n=1 Tax=Streptomyces sp. NPDC050204 TaxID=3155514 RepID=UPI0034377052
MTAPAASADDTGKYKPSGVGDLMPSPFIPNGQGTLFETYEPSAYQLDKQLSTDLTGGDLIDGSMHEVASILMGILSMVGRAAITITQWCFNAVSLPEIEPAISRAISAAATPMATMFLPTAVAVGMFLAWARRSDQSMFGQLAWVVASAAIACTFFTSPQMWVKGVDEARQTGATVAMTTISGGLAGDTSNAVPFQTPQPRWSGEDRDDTLRRASDAIWRTYVATPWCVADLGSLEACKRWGPELLKRGDDLDDKGDYLAEHLDPSSTNGLSNREDYLKEHMNLKNAGSDAVKWRQGHTPSGRIGVLVAAVISVVIFSALVILLAATTLASLLGALMLLVCGVVFACLWCIPGKPRQWGVSWFESLIGLTVVSFTSTMLLGSVMIVNTALLSLLNDFGWLMVSLLNIAAVAMAFKLKNRLDGIVSAGGAQLTGRGILSTVGHLAARRSLARAVGRSRSSNSNPGGGRARRGGGGGGHGGPGSGGPSAPSPSPAGGPYDFRVTRTRTYPPPPNYAPVAGGSYGDHIASRPGLPGGPGGPSGPGGPPGGRPPQPADARSAKADAARQKAAARSGYAVRPGPPERTGVPPQTGPNGKRSIQGTVLKRTDSEAAPRFRSYPSAPAQPASAARKPVRPVRQSDSTRRQPPITKWPVKQGDVYYPQPRTGPQRPS